MLAKTKAQMLRSDNLDLIEKVVLFPGYLFFCYRMIHGYMETGSPVTLLYLADQLVVFMFFMMRRRAREVSVRLGDWLFGIVGTFLPIMMAPPGPAAIAPASVFVLLMLLGFAVHVSAKLTLRRSFGVVAANRGVKASGPYRIVRHPMYLGYMLTHLGVLLAGPTAGNIAIVTACWALFMVRIVGEERILSRDTAYQSFSAVTHYRLVPGLF